MAENPLENNSQDNFEIKKQTISGGKQQIADKIQNDTNAANYVEGSVSGGNIAGRDVHITQIYNPPVESKPEPKHGLGDFLRQLFSRSPKAKVNDQPLPSAIKGLMAFTDEDGELFLKLERGNELAQLKNYLFDPQIGLLVMMGESGAGKTSLLRAGLSHLLKDKDCRYVYWEARPTEAVAGLLKSIQQGLGVEVKDLTALLTLNTRAVIVLDQFEQLLPDKAEFAAIFNLLKAISLVPPPYKITWIIAFRREYAADWLDFETQLDEQFKFSHSQRLSLKLFSEAQARNVMATLASSAGLSLEPPLLDAFISSVHRDQRLSPVDIGIGLLMLQELAVEKNQPKLSLADYQFAGGSQGLFVLFLTNKIEQRFDNKREQEAFFEALLELVDLNIDQRIAEGKSFVELSAKAKGLKEQALESALNYFASGQVRLLEKIVRTDGCKAYRLPHESMIPALRQLGNKLLSEIAQANLILQKAFLAWQSSVKKDSRFLLQGKDLKTVLKFKEQLDLQNKELFLKNSVRKTNITRSVIAAVVFGLSVSGYLGHQYWQEYKQETNYRTSLKAWDLPGDLRDYSEQITDLTVTKKEMLSLTWLAKFTHLTTLNLDLNNALTIDMSVLNSLKSLTSLNLNLSGTQITDLSALNGLQSLTSLELNLWDSKITDLSALNGLQSLTSLDLDLSNSKITDLSALSGLKSLTSLDLDLSNSKITDLSALNGLQSLTSLELNLSNSKITDLSALNGLKSLTSLNLDLNSQITDLSALKGLIGLTTLNLDLRGSKITKLSTLKELKSLISLTLKGTEIKDPDFFANFNQLTKLDIRGTKINSLKGLPPSVTELAVGN